MLVKSIRRLILDQQRSSNRWPGSRHRSIRLLCKTFRGGQQEQMRRTFDLAVCSFLALDLPDAVAEYVDAAKTQALADGMISDEATPQGAFDPEVLEELLRAKRMAGKREVHRVEEDSAVMAHGAGPHAAAPLY